MKHIEAAGLKVGDIFTKEICAKGREAFKVVEVTDNSILCTSRNDSKKRKNIKRFGKNGIVIKLS